MVLGEKVIRFRRRIGEDLVKLFDLIANNIGKCGLMRDAKLSYRINHTPPLQRPSGLVMYFGSPSDSEPLTPHGPILCGEVRALHGCVGGEAVQSDLLG